MLVLEYSLEGRLAQLVEQLTLNQRVVGSNPPAPTRKTGGFRGFLQLKKWSGYTWGILFTDCFPDLCLLFCPDRGFFLNFERPRRGARVAVLLQTQGF